MGDASYCYTVAKCRLVSILVTDLRARGPSVAIRARRKPIAVRTTGLLRRARMFFFSFRGVNDTERSRKLRLLYFSPFSCAFNYVQFSQRYIPENENCWPFTFLATFFVGIKVSGELYDSRQKWLLFPLLTGLGSFFWRFPGRRDNVRVVVEKVM